MFRVAATIPGATLLPHAMNAAGQEGLAVARIGQSNTQDSELIFSPHTYRFLGERATLVIPQKNVGPAGTVIQSTAQLKVTIASHLPRTRTSAPSTSSSC